MQDWDGVMEGLGVGCGRRSFSRSSISCHNDAMGVLTSGVVVEAREPLLLVNISTCESRAWR